MSRPLLLLAVLAAGSGAAGAEPATVRGVVIDAETGAPIPGALVQTAGGDSALTDGRGAFAIAAVAGERLAISAAAHAAVTARVTGAPLEIALAPRADDPEVIEIEGKAPYRGKPPTYELTPDVIRRMPGSGNDALKSLQAMPGVGRVPFGVGGLVLRGTSPRDSRVYIEGIEVPLLYHFAGLASFVPSTQLESLELVSGGYSAELGRGQGGVAVLGWRPGRTDRWRVGSELSMIDLSVRADGPVGERGAWSIALRRSVVDAVLPLFADDVGLTTAPRYLDGQLRYDLERPWRGGHLAFLLLGSDDAMSVEYGDNQDKRFTLETRFARLGVRYDQQLGPLSEMRVVPWVGVERYHLASTFQTMTSSNTPAGLRAEVKRTNSLGHVRGGVDLAAGDYAVDSLSIDDVDASEIAIDGAGGYLDAAAWLEATVRLAGGRVGLKPGLRVDSFDLAGEVTVDPRMVVTHELGRVTLRESLGVFHQGPTPADALWGNDDLGTSYSIQSTAGVKVAVTEATDIGVTGFYSELYDLPVDDPDADDDALDDFDTYKIGAIASTREFLAKQFGSFSELVNTGRGRNVGAELLVRHVGARGFGWLAYTLSRSRRRDAPNMPERPYILDQRHVLTALGSLKLGKNWRLGARVRLATGNPITPVIGADMVGDDEFEPIYGPELSERLPLFVQLDVRLDRAWHRSWGTIHAFVDVQNVSNRDNIEGRVYADDYSSFETTKGLPVFPSFGVEYAPRDDR